MDAGTLNAKVQAQIDGHPSRVLLAAVGAHLVVALRQGVEQRLGLKHPVVLYQLVTSTVQAFSSEHRTKEEEEDGLTY
jgi:uncharacterized membrane protein YhhN